MSLSSKWVKWRKIQGEIPLLRSRIIYYLSSRLSAFICGSISTTLSSRRQRKRRSARRDPSDLVGGGGHRQKIMRVVAAVVLLLFVAGTAADHVPEWIKDGTLRLGEIQARRLGLTAGTISNANALDSTGCSATSDDGGWGCKFCFTMGNNTVRWLLTNLNM